MGDVIIKNNTFTNNVRDLVLGTNSPGGDTTQAETANFDRYEKWVQATCLST